MTMTPQQFDYLSRFVRRASAIVLEPGKEYLVESRLAPIARREGLDSVGRLIERLQASRGESPLGVEIIDAMTTNETSFFRDAHAWNTLRDVILPQLIAARAEARRLTFWCAACSSGQEPYSLAMLLREHHPAIVDDWRVQIIATDLSGGVLQRAKAARFSQLEVNRGLPAAMLMRYFTRQGVDWQLVDEVRRMVQVRAANLAEPQHWLPVGGVDLVMMRNVLIYFDDTTRSAVLADAHRRLRPGGVLMLGSSETVIGTENGFVRNQAGTTVYFHRA